MGLTILFSMILIDAKRHNVTCISSFLGDQKVSKVSKLFHFTCKPLPQSRSRLNHQDNLSSASSKKYEEPIYVTQKFVMGRRGPLISMSKPTRSNSELGSPHLFAQRQDAPPTSILYYVTVLKIQQKSTSNSRVTF